MNFLPYLSNQMFILYEQGNKSLFNLLPYVYMVSLLILIALCLFLFVVENKKLIFITLCVFSTIFFIVTVDRVIPYLSNISTYITVGEYLRDNQGINIFSGDWSSWILSMAPLDIMLTLLFFYSVWKKGNYLTKRMSTR
jgi:hypothetical protein